MDVAHKLRLIQEGYSIDEINSGETKSFPVIDESVIIDDFYIFAESILADIDYITETSIDKLQESGSDKKSIFRKFIDWIIEKIRQFKIFLTDLFKRRKESNKKHIEYLRQLTKKEFKPFMVSNTLEKIVSSPDEAIKTLKELVEKFEDNMVEKIDVARDGRWKEVTENTTVAELQAITWKQVLNNENISYNGNVTHNVIDYILGKTNVIRIHSKEQIDNIIRFCDEFYELWHSMNYSLSFYQKQIKQLSEFDDAGYAIIKVICDTIIQTFPEILRIVDGYIRRFSMIGNYVD